MSTSSMTFGQQFDENTDPKLRSWTVDEGVWHLRWYNDRSPVLELRNGRSGLARVNLDDYGVHVEVLRCLPRQDVHVPLEVLSAFVDATTKWSER